MTTELKILWIPNDTLGDWPILCESEQKKLIKNHNNSNGCWRVTYDDFAKFPISIDDAGMYIEQCRRADGRSYTQRVNVMYENGEFILGD